MGTLSRGSTAFAMIQRGNEKAGGRGGRGCAANNLHTSPRYGGLTDLNPVNHCVPLAFTSVAHGLKGAYSMSGSISNLRGYSTCKLRLFRSDSIFVSSA